MSSSYTNINIHIIFHTKYYGLTIKEEDLSEVFHYIGGLIRTLSGVAYKVGGRPDHIHILSSLPPTTSLSDYVRKIKSNSSKWIKGLDERYKLFEWQEGYGAFSISSSLLDKTIQYIRMQEEHHKKRNAKEEFKLFLDAYKMEYDERYLIDD